MCLTNLNSLLVHNLVFLFETKASGETASKMTAVKFCTRHPVLKLLNHYSFTEDVHGWFGDRCLITHGLMSGCIISSGDGLAELSQRLRVLAGAETGPEHRDKTGDSECV